MKSIAFLGLALACTSLANAQNAGNYTYYGNINYDGGGVTLETDLVNVRWNSPTEALVSVTGLNNVKADAYVAIYSITQVGKTTEEVNRLLDERIKTVQTQLAALGSDLEVYVDMVSFVPQYEYDVEKKIFSSTTYNEVPVGFELKKNLHVRYTDHALMEGIIATCASAEIYDLVRVDYILDDIEARKNELIAKSKTMITQKLADYSAMTGKDLTSAQKKLADGFEVFYPVERYKSYQAFSQAVLDPKKNSHVNRATKSKTLHYMPISGKDFDFVINPVVVEPCVQILYKVELMVDLDLKQKELKEYYIIAPNGEMKPINIAQ